MLPPAADPRMSARKVVVIGSTSAAEATGVPQPLPPAPGHPGGVSQAWLGDVAVHPIDALHLHGLLSAEHVGHVPRSRHEQLRSSGPPFRPTVRPGRLIGGNPRPTRVTRYRSLWRPHVSGPSPRVKDLHRQLTRRELGGRNRAGQQLARDTEGLGHRVSPWVLMRELPRTRVEVVPRPRALVNCGSGCCRPGWSYSTCSPWRCSWTWAPGA